MNVFDWGDFRIFLVYTSSLIYIANCFALISTLIKIFNTISIDEIIYCVRFFCSNIRLEYSQFYFQTFYSQSSLSKHAMAATTPRIFATIDDDLNLCRRTRKGLSWKLLNQQSKTHQTRIVCNVHIRFTWGVGCDTFCWPFQDIVVRTEAFSSHSFQLLCHSNFGFWKKNWLHFSERVEDVCFLPDEKPGSPSRQYWETSVEKQICGFPVKETGISQKTRNLLHSRCIFFRVQLYWHFDQLLPFLFSPFK